MAPLRVCPCRDATGEHPRNTRQATGGLQDAENVRPVKSGAQGGLGGSTVAKVLPTNDVKTKGRKVQRSGHSGNKHDSLGCESPSYPFRSVDSESGSYLPSHGVRSFSVSMDLKGCVSLLHTT